MTDHLAALDQIAAALGLCADEGHDKSLLVSRATQLKAARDEAIKERDEQRARAELEIRRAASYSAMFDNAFQRRQHALAEAKSLREKCLELGQHVNASRNDAVRFMRERDEAVARALKLGDALRAVQAQPDDERWLDGVTYWRNRASFIEKAHAALVARVAQLEAQIESLKPAEDLTAWTDADAPGLLRRLLESVDNRGLWASLLHRLPSDVGGLTDEDRIIVQREHAAFRATRKNPL